MSGESGLSITKPTPVLKKSIKVDFKNFSKALGKGVVDLSFGKFDGLAGDVVEALSALGLASNAEEIAWFLVFRSLLLAMKTLIDEKTELGPEKYDIKLLQTQINQALDTSSLTINKKFFEHPDRDAIVVKIIPTFLEWLKQCGLSDADAQAISERLPIYFATALHDEWGRHAKEYEVLKEKLDTPFTQASERTQAWLRYATWLQKQVEEPMFLEAFSLNRVYVPLRAYYNRKIDGQKPDELEGRLSGERRSERVVVELEKELESWLSKAVKTDAIRLISGGPGSGKSSFSKMFAAKLAAKGTIPVLFIPLHHFEPSDDLIDAVGKFVQMDDILPHNPLAIEQREGKLLIIFDGLDELAMQGKIAEKTAHEFVREIQRKVDRLNQRETCLQVIISGRELVVQANETDFRKDGQILHVLPYFVPEPEWKNYIDAKKLLKQDQRQLWWQYYGAASGSGYAGLPTELDRGNLIEVTAQPLLNYLVALSLRRGKLQFSEGINLNAIYADLIKAIYERGWAENQHTAIQGITEEDFVRILEEIALAAWHGNGRTTTVGDIERHCESSNLKNLLNRFQEGYQPDSKANITRLMTAFYFRQSGHDHSGDKTFEFTHKSFGEYLTARRIVQEVDFIHRKLKNRYNDSYENWDERSALHRWILVCGASVMDEYLFNFILDEMRLHHMQNPNDVVAWQQTLCDLISFMVQQGMPVERLSPRLSFHEEKKQARNSEEALLAVLNSCARVNKCVSKIKWLAPDSFGNWVLTLKKQRNSHENVLALSCFSYLNLEHCILDMQDFYFADFSYANLTGAELYDSILIGANFVEANLQGAGMFGANLLKVNMVDANLMDVNLHNANLIGARLQGANLEGAVLARANLEGANLVGANLINANLMGAQLIGANLQGAHLVGANLERANFHGANLVRANLEKANLIGMNLLEANLFGANLKGTILEGKVS